MFETFIAKHRRLVAILLVVATVLLIGGIYFAATNQNSNTRENTSTDIDNGGENSTLPYSNYLYTIQYTPNSSDHGLTITAYAGYRNAAVDKLYEFGLDPANYKITFNYESPFKQYE